MTVTLGNILSIVGMVITVIGVIVVLDRRIEKKADREVMTKEFEVIKLALQKLSDQMTQLGGKIDDMKEDHERYKKMQEELQKDMIILQTEHDARKHKC